MRRTQSCPAPISHPSPPPGERFATGTIIFVCCLINPEPHKVCKSILQSFDPRLKQRQSGTLQDTITVIIQFGDYGSSAFGRHGLRLPRRAPAVSCRHLMLGSSVASAGQTARTRCGLAPSSDPCAKGQALIASRSPPARVLRPDGSPFRSQSPTYPFQICQSQPDALPRILQGNKDIRDRHQSPELPQRKAVPCQPRSNLRRVALRGNQSRSACSSPTKTLTQSSGWKGSILLSPGNVLIPVQR